MSDLSKNGQSPHPYIVTILRHGLLEPIKSHYYLDMELGCFSLQTYIASLFKGPDLVFDWIEDNSPVVIPRDALPLEKVQNTWSIAVHITSGLEYLHSRKFVHRDLKPSNGIHTCY